MTDSGNDQPRDIVPYSHEEAVTSITKYFQLVCRAHKASNSSVELHFPPPGGWPQMTKQVAVEMGYNDAAANLIRHMPYFNDPFGYPVEILPRVCMCGPVFHHAPWVQQEPDKDDTEGVKTNYNGPGSHLVCLGRAGQEDEWGNELWIDTELGNAITGSHHGFDLPNMYDNPQVEPNYTGYEDDDDDDPYENLFPGPIPDSPTDDPDEIERRRWASTSASMVWPIGAFFRACERNLKELNWLPGVSGEDAGRLRQAGDEEVYLGLDLDGRRNLLRSHGWPGDRWDPEGFQSEMERVQGMRQLNLE